MANDQNCELRPGKPIDHAFVESFPSERMISRRFLDRREARQLRDRDRGESDA